MKDEKDSQPTAEVPDPLDVMRDVLRGMEFNFDDADGRLVVHLMLDRLDVKVVCWGNPDDVATILVVLPVRATPEFRPQTGEFLHRLNYGAKRKYWEMDYGDGEIRLAAYTDTLIGPLTGQHFRGMLHSMVRTADIVFPYLTSVLSGRMTPEFADDQAEAAIHAFWNKDTDTPEEGDGKAESGD